MISFDPTLLNIEFVHLKVVTTALGGSITVVDYDQPLDEKGRAETKRMPIPFAVARTFIKRHDKATQYLHPVWVALVRYGDLIVAMERHPLASMGELETNGQRWEPICGRVIDQLQLFFKKDTNEWYFDGRYIYKFNGHDHKQIVQSSPSLESSNKFRRVLVNAIDTMMLTEPKVTVNERTCVAYISNQHMAISPPIWTGYSTATNIKLVADEADDRNEGTESTGNVLNRFDKVDSEFIVNLQFALRAGIEISKHYGFEAVQPLKLPLLMINLNTVNLPALPKHVKATYDTKMKFTQVMTWLLGLYSRADTIETMISIRSLFNYLTKRGLVRSASHKLESIYVDPSNREVPLMNEDLEDDLEGVQVAVA